ncbi:uncharacterized protein LOC142145880 isoform X2 [Mixophyes fleayi]|uniref:uncharacterized protein LOC142145880 isoform X2 n=1 Tax=Mixophyes fleayi TaxID=3061075 RepID=UPI003F4E3409
MEDQTMSHFGVKNAENKPLRNFTIPKLKRDTEKDCFVCCMPNRREFNDILDTFSRERLNMSCDLMLWWKFLDMKLVLNKDLQQNFFEKRTEMKELGRHGRELEEKFCFLVVPNQVAKDISSCGLSAENMATSVLGNPEMGVYLFRHIDVALNFAHQINRVSNVVVVFKVLCGKVKKINTSSGMKVALDPTPNFDSHVSKKAPLWNDPFDEQVANSLIYVYEYDRQCKPVKTPRQCLPIASVYASFVATKTVKTSGPVYLPSKAISPEHQPKIQKRKKKRKKETTTPQVTIKNIQEGKVTLHHPKLHSRTSSRRERSQYIAPNFTQGNDTFASCTVAQRIGKGKDATIVFQSVHSTLLKPSEKETSQNNGSVAEAQTIAFTDTDQHSDIHSSMVIASKSMKDPRLLQRNEQEALIPADQYQTGHQKQNSLFCENMVSSNKESEEDFVNCENIINKTPLYLSFEETHVSDQNFMSEEQLMNEDRDAEIQSLKRLSNEEKAGLSRMLCTYDKYYRMFANQLEIAKEQNQSKLALSPDNSLPVCPQVAVYVPVSASDYTTKGNKYGHLQNKSQLFSSWTDRGKDECSQYMAQETNQKNKAPEGSKNSLRENYKQDLSSPKNNSVCKTTVVTSKAKVLENGQSSVNHVNCKTDTPDLGKAKVCKTEVYPNSRNGPNVVKSQRTPFNVEKEFPAEINAAIGHKKPTRIADPPLLRQKLNCLKVEEKCVLKKSPEKKIQHLSSNVLWKVI